MKTPATLLSINLLLCSLPANAWDRAADLEARLKETAETSPTAARMMLELIALYESDEQLFGIIRTAGKFSRAQPDHPRRAEIMHKLVEGYAITGRHGDVITIGRQFREKFPDHALSLEVRRHMATTYERTGRYLQAARELDANWRQGSVVQDGVDALRLYQDAKSAEGFRLATDLVSVMVDKLPADTILSGCGLVGLEMAARAELWAEGLAIAKALLRRNAPLIAREKQAVVEIGTFRGG